MLVCIKKQYWYDSKQWMPVYSKKRTGREFIKFREPECTGPYTDQLPAKLVSMDPCQVRRRRRAFSSCPGKRGHFAVRIALVITESSIHELLPPHQEPVQGKPVGKLPGARPTPISRPASFPVFHLRCFPGRVSPRCRIRQAFPLFPSDASRGAFHPDIAPGRLSLFSPQKLPGARLTPISRPASFPSASFPSRRAK